MSSYLHPEFKPHELMRFYRVRASLTQAAIALSLRRSQMYVSRIEQGKVEPTDEEIKIIEQKLMVPIWSVKRS
ncbi:helix-turn-helix transcriptional regulator [Aneurinibacillus thermoaerophilus]|uniref:helix-turn-helix domain-containing protein n=1 Tax=Aneurinibacillus thermoaerophilus TaxID=143495 RepID=UPI002E238513|nr:helix-turn-helix transcriptional regulator [Aneurinibacillus thermoaerophilus]